MTRVEERLSGLLHAAAPPSDGVAFAAVKQQARRRRTRHRSLVASTAAAAVALVVVSVTTLAGTSRPGHRTATPALNLAGAIPWTDRPASPYHAPPAPPPSRPATDARPCTAADVTAAMADGNGAGGHTIRYVRFRNVSTSTCVLKGYPQVTATEPGRTDVAGTDGSFFPTPGTANMRPGQDTFLGVETDTSCAARPGGGPPGPLYHHLAITPPGGGTITVDAAGFDVTCGLHLTRFFIQRGPAPAPPDPLGELSVALEMPPHVAAGSTLVYVADLTNPTDRAIRLDRCPGYAETATGTVSSVKELYALNCAPVGAIAAHDTVRFEMRLRVPAEATAGPLTVHWMLAGPFEVTGRATVTVTSPGTSSAGVTVSGVLRLTGGPAGASQPGVPGSVFFDDLAGEHSYSTTATADGSFTVAIPPGRYAVTGTSPQFNDGNGRCSADGPVQVSGAGLSGVVVACPRK